MLDLILISGEIDLGIIFAGATNIGQKRKSNQDAICLDSSQMLYAVADGMGGHNGGDIASKITVDSLPAFVQENSHLPPEECLENSIHQVNQAVYQKSLEVPELKGMGTTITSVLFRENKVYVGNVGDSRTYLINNYKLYQLSKDHSLVQEKLNMGLYDRVTASRDPQKNVLVRTVGFEENIKVDIFNYSISNNDLFLLCSDGLYGMVSERDIMHLVHEKLPELSAVTEESLEELVDALIKLANQNGGNDNVSVIVAMAKN